MIAIEIQSFCPYRAGGPLHTNTQGVALGCELVGLSGRFAHPLRRHRSYGSPPRHGWSNGNPLKALVAQGKSKHAPLLK